MLLLAAALIVLPHLLSLFAAGDPRPARDQRAAGLELSAADADRRVVACACGASWAWAPMARRSSAKELGVPVPLSMLVGASIAAFLAFLLSFPLFRMKGFYFLIGSFAAGEVIRLVWKWSELTWLFGGPKGIKLIPPFPDIDAALESISTTRCTTTISA